MKFKNNTLATTEILEKMRDVKSFLGVFPIDKIPKVNNSRWSMIVNLEPSTMGGSHWVALYNKPSNKYLYYFDSFSMPPPTAIMKLKSLKPIVYNSSMIQAMASTSCGYFCMAFIRWLEADRDYLDFVQYFDDGYSESSGAKNEKLLQKLLSIL